MIDNYTLSNLEKQGWTSQDDFFPPDLCAELRDLITRESAAGTMKKAGIGRGENFRIDPELRADFIRWIDDQDSSAAIIQVKNIFEEFRRSINRELFLGLNGFEGHLTVYPAGAGYARHLDQFADKSSRTISLIVYLNEGWLPENGGCLRIFGNDDPKTETDILPVSGRMVAFVSNETFHQVLPNNKPRYSLTGWFLR